MSRRAQLGEHAFQRERTSALCFALLRESLANEATQYQVRTPRLQWVARTIRTVHSTVRGAVALHRTTLPSLDALCA